MFSILSSHALYSLLFLSSSFFSFFFFNDPAPTEIYTLSLHDALPISLPAHASIYPGAVYLGLVEHRSRHVEPEIDRKSTRLNSSHVEISYAVFCLKKKKKKKKKKRTIQNKSRKKTKRRQEV